MATVLIAVGDRPLRRLCETSLLEAGHAFVPLERPLQALDMVAKVRSHVALVDSSPLGRDALRVARGELAPQIVGLGIDWPGLAVSLGLPVDGGQVIDAVEKLAGGRAAPQRLTVEAGRRVARANNGEVALTRTEFLLLEALMANPGGEVAPEEVMEAVWGPGDWSRNVGLLRAHMRNLRLKLAQIGLSNAIRSRRGRGYALHL